MLRFTRLLNGLYSTDAKIAFQKLSFTEAKKEINKSTTLLLDVREKAELSSDGRISQSKNIPWEIIPAFEMDSESFKANYGFDKPVQDKEIIIHCKAGIRAMQAASTLNQIGYSNIKVYDGILDWISNGGRVIK